MSFIIEMAWRVTVRTTAPLPECRMACDVGMCISPFAHSGCGWPSKCLTAVCGLSMLRKANLVVLPRVAALQHLLEQGALQFMNRLLSRQLHALGPISSGCPRAGGGSGRPAVF